MTTSKSKPNKTQIIINGIFAIVIVGLIIQNFFFKSKIAYIDIDKIFGQYKGIQIAKKEYDKKVELYKERVDTLTGRVKLDILNIEKNGADKAKSKSYIDSVKYHKKQLTDYQQAMTRSLREEEGKLTQNAVSKLNDFLKIYGKEKGYDMILIANNTGTIAYAKDKFDITDDVLKEINEQN